MTEFRMEQLKETLQQPLNPDWPGLFYRDHVPRRTLENPDPKPQVSTCYVYAELDEFCEPQLVSDPSPDPRKPSWLEYEMDAEGLQGVIDPAIQFEEGWVRWALDNGLCPGQWFVLKLVPTYSRSYIWEYACYEYDFECDWEIISREILSPAEHADRWDEWIRKWEREQ